MAEALWTGVRSYILKEEFPDIRY